MGDKLYTDFSGGLNLLDSPDSIAINESPNAINVDGTQKGSLKPRKGLGVVTTFTSFLGGPHQIVILTEFNPRNRVLPVGTVIPPGSQYRIQGDSRGMLQFGWQTSPGFLSPYFDPQPVRRGGGGGGGTHWSETVTATDASASITAVRQYIVQRADYSCSSGGALAPVIVYTADYTGPFLGATAHNALNGRGPSAGNGSACVAGGSGGTVVNSLTGFLGVTGTYAAFAAGEVGTYAMYIRVDGGSTDIYAGMSEVSGTATTATISTPTYLATPIAASSGDKGSYANAHNYVLYGVRKLVVKRTLA